MSWSDLLPSFSKDGKDKDREKLKEKEHAKDEVIAEKEELIQQLTDRIKKQQAELGITATKEHVI